MVRGKKNFLPPSYLVYGFGFIFKVSITLQINDSVHTIYKVRVNRQNRGATKRIYNLEVCLHLPFFSPFNAAPFNGPFFD